MYRESKALPSAPPTEDAPDLPAYVDVIGAVAFVSFVASHVVENLRARRILRAVTAATGVPWVYKMNQYNGHYKQDLFGRGDPGQANTSDCDIIES